MTVRYFKDCSILAGIFAVHSTQTDLHGLLHGSVKAVPDSEDIKSPSMFVGKESGEGWRKRRGKRFSLHFQLNILFCGGGEMACTPRRSAKSHWPSPDLEMGGSAPGPVKYVTASDTMRTAGGIGTGRNADKSRIAARGEETSFHLQLT